MFIFWCQESKSGLHACYTHLQLLSYNLSHNFFLSSGISEVLIVILVVFTVLWMILSLDCMLQEEKNLCFILGWIPVPWQSSCHIVETETFFCSELTCQNKLSTTRQHTVVALLCTAFIQQVLTRIPKLMQPSEIPHVENMSSLTYMWESEALCTYCVP